MATCGILVAERATALGHQVTKIAVANAIEALACFVALQALQGNRDSRVRGSTKLAGRTLQEFSFQNASRPSFYVSQPMRMATVTTLPALGLVEASGSRFNGFSCSEAGLAFVEAASVEYRPYNRSLVDHLLQWVLGKDDRLNGDALPMALSPMTPLPPEALVLLRERLHQGAPTSQSWERQRRSDALHWVASRGLGAAPVDWKEKPALIGNASHWADMRAGAYFFAARDAAHDVLNAVETHMGTPENRLSLASKVPKRAHAPLTELREKTRAFLDLEHEDMEANTFCREVVEQSDMEILRRLVDRDGRILRLVGQHICAGPAFQGSREETSEVDIEESPEPEELEWPENISYRIPNIWWLSQDLDGRLSDCLSPSAEDELPEVAYG
ncbi:hypothetical protein [Thiorhodococcus mannitoliphagus]|uniref:hypothetical protein n=1 Tax=Thiorhodococcus mannitoliphagus TaxID=329406 RepID=UPI0013DE9F77|nr:hypothetical protein [Thiorhodococcus mannitoliphagus]